MAKGMLPLWRGWSIFPDGGVWRRCPQLHWFRNIQSSCFEVAPVFSLWISNSFLSSFVAGAAWRDLEGIFSPKANIWAWSYPWRRGGFGNLPSCKGLVVWNPSLTGVCTLCCRQRLYKGAGEYGETKEWDFPLPQSTLALHTVITAHTANLQKKQ